MKHHKLWLSATAIALTISTLVSHPIAAQTQESYSPEQVADIRARAEAGDAEAQYNLGNMYDNGKGVAQNYQQAVYWLRKAAEQDHVKAQFKLGAMYDYGKRVARDYQQAAYWYRKAATQGYAYAQNNLGLMYGEGLGIVQNYSRAYFWFSVAAAQGNKLAISNRDNEIENLSHQEVVRVQSAAAQCIESNYINCREP